MAQIITAMREADRPVTNLVFMGMGEPLDNLDAVTKTVALLQEENGAAFSPRRITVSTCGLIDRIRDLAESGLKLKLAVSLNSALQAKRTELMPVAQANPLPELKKALQYFKRKTSYRVTLEYIVLGGYNSGEEDARALVAFAGDLSCKINLIAYNPVPGLPWKRPTEVEFANFARMAEVAGAAVTIRKSRGTDIAAACGQLAANTK